MKCVNLGEIKSETSAPSARMSRRDQPRTLPETLALSGRGVRNDDFSRFDLEKTPFRSEEKPG
jgi:hypothetical protein